MSLTEEQRERIRKNRERALEIRRRKLQEAEEEAEAARRTQQQQKEEDEKQTTTAAATSKVDANTKTQNEDRKEEEEEVELEDFEIDASRYVTKQEAMKKYCLPAGTLEVCDYIEKDNPRQSKWNKMKLYHRSEIRKRARERWGGLEGLQEERRRRELKRSEKDMEDGYRVFKKQKQNHKK